MYEAGKLVAGSSGAKPLYSAELKEGLVAAVYPGGSGVGGWELVGAGLVVELAVGWMAEV